MNHIIISEPVTTLGRLWSSSRLLYLKLAVKRSLYAIRVRDRLVGINLWRNCKMLTGPTWIYNVVNKYMEIYDNGFPYKKIKRSDHCLSKPWISLGSLKSIKKKNKLYKKYFSNPSNHSKVHYKRYRKNLNHRPWQNVQQEIWESKSNVKATCGVLNKVINKTKAKPKLNSSIKR